MQLYPAMAQTLDPDGFRNWNKHIFMPLMVEDPSLIDVMFPDTIDEMKAEGENEQLQENMFVQVDETDDHQTHIYTHMMSQPKTWQTWLHLDWHKKLLAEQKKQEMEAIQMQMSGNMESSGNTSGGSKPKFGKDKKSTQGASTPLKTEISSDVNK